MQQKPLSKRKWVMQSNNRWPRTYVPDTSDLRLQTSLHSNQSIQSDISYQTLLSIT